MTLPNEVLAAFPVTAALAFIPGPVGEIAAAFAGAFACGIVLVGLAVLHAVTRGTATRIPLLVLAYLLLIFSGLPIVLFVLLGAAETFFHLRARGRANRSTP